MSVSSVSLQEINAARVTQPTQTYVAPKKESKVSDTKRYVDRFKDDQIANFFAPYGYIQHERSEDGTMILVLCNDCQIIFDDFTVMAEPFISFFSNNQDFNFEEFASICEQGNTTPNQAIAARLEEEVFNKMPYYVENKLKFVQNNLKQISKDSKYGKLLSPSIEKLLFESQRAKLLKDYGSTEPEVIADTLARVIPGK